MTTKVNEADLLYSFLEYHAMYQEPIFSSLLNADCLSTLYHAFKEWNVSLANISANANPTNASEYRTTIELLKGKYIFTATLGGASFSVINPSWEEAAEIIKIMQRGLEAIRESANAVIARQSVQHSLHLKPRNHSVRELTAGFLNTRLISGLEEDVRAYGFSIYSENSSWIVDLSAYDPESLFVRLNQAFEAEISLEEIARKVNLDQARILDILNLKIFEGEN